MAPESFPPALEPGHARLVSSSLTGVHKGRWGWGRWAQAGGQRLPECGPCRCLQIPELEEAKRFEAGQSRALRLLRAVYQCLAAHSELLCYFIIILNHMVTASAASLVLPVLVFLWAMLSIPRPSKRFWMTAIVFTEVAAAGGWAGGEGLAPPC